MRRAIAVLLLAGCGGSWSSADTKSVTDAVRAQLVLEQLCAVDAGSGCYPAMVRAMERSSACNLESAIARHGAPVPDAGIEGCQP